MRTRFFLLGFLLAFTQLSQAQTPKFKTAIEYNDYIVDLQNGIGKGLIAFNEELGRETSSRETCLPLLESVIATTESAVKKVSGMPDFEGNVELRDASTQLFQFYLKTCQNEYFSILDIIFQDSPSEAEYDELNKILNSVVEAESLLDQKFQSAQERFASRFGFTLTENELQEKIDGEE